MTISLFDSESNILKQVLVVDTPAVIHALRLL